MATTPSFATIRPEGHKRRVTEMLYMPPPLKRGHPTSGFSMDFDEFEVAHHLADLPKRRRTESGGVVTSGTSHTSTIYTPAARKAAMQIPAHKPFVNSGRIPLMRAKAEAAARRDTHQAAQEILENMKELSGRVTNDLLEVISLGFEAKQRAEKLEERAALGRRSARESAERILACQLELKEFQAQAAAIEAQIDACLLALERSGRDEGDHLKYTNLVSKQEASVMDAMELQVEWRAQTCGRSLTTDCAYLLSYVEKVTRKMDLPLDIRAQLSPEDVECALEAGRTVARQLLRSRKNANKNLPQDLVTGLGRLSSYMRLEPSSAARRLARTEEEVVRGAVMLEARRLISNNAEANKRAAILSEARQASTKHEEAVAEVHECERRLLGFAGRAQTARAVQEKADQAVIDAWKDVSATTDELSVMGRLFQNTVTKEATVQATVRKTREAWDEALLELARAKENAIKTRRTSVWP